MVLVIPLSGGGRNWEAATMWVITVQAPVSHPHLPTPIAGIIGGRVFGVGGV